jgi:transposase
MARAYSQDLRTRVLDATTRGMSARQAAAHFGIGAATAIVWVRRARDEGETAARRQGQPKGSKLDGQADFLLGLIAAKPDITLREMQQRLRDEGGLPAGIGTLWRFFAARAFTFKKNRARRRTGSAGYRRGSRSLV